MSNVRGGGGGGTVQKGPGMGPVMESLHNYHPQRSCGKVMFLHLSVILSMGGGGLCPGDPCPGRGSLLSTVGTHATGMYSCLCMTLI